MRNNNKFGFIRVFRLRIVGLALAVVLQGCGLGDAYFLVPQQWNDTEFLVEIRPGAPRKGMNEFVVVATHSTGVPGYQYVVSIKTDNGDRWAQMIQDGHSGVYRRAIAVNDPENGVLNVQIKHQEEKDKQTTLRYPLSNNVK